MTPSMRLHRISLRLILASTLSVGALIAVCALSVASMRRLSDLASAALKHNVELLDNAAAVEAVLAQRGLATEYALTGEERWLEELNQRRAVFLAWLARAQGDEQSPEGHALLAQLSVGYAGYDSARQAAISATRRGDRAAAREALARSQDQGRTVIAISQEYDQRARRQGERSLDRARRVLRDYTLLLLSISVAGAVASVLSGYLLARRIAKPIYQIQLQVESAARRVSIPVTAGSDLEGMGDQLAALLKRLEDTDAAILEQRQRLIQSEKLSTLGELSAKLAHEVLNPLAGMKAAVQLLLRGRERPYEQPYDPVEVQDTARALNGEIDRVELLLRRLIDYAKPLTPRLESCPAAQLLRSAQEAAQTALAAAGVALLRRGDDEATLPTLEVDPLLLVQALTNLLVNAAQASRPGGTVTLDARRCQHLGLPHLAIEVLDEGAGIPAALLERLFRPFFTTKSRGNGLGLAITQNILMEHGGLVSARNREDHAGAVFTLLLPIREP